MDGLILQKQRFSAKQIRAPILNRKSHTISKFKPKIRIIHILAPEIIKADATNFRELVQRLTGKSASDIEETKTIRSSKPTAIMRMNMTERLKGEEEIWTAADSGCGFLDDFAHVDGIFMQNFHQTSFLETTTMNSSHYAN